MAVTLERSATLTGLAPEARCLYDIYKKEGDELYCKRRYKKALVSYNEALRLVNRNPQTLVARSRCYMGIGMMQRALEDAEGALDINATYLPAIYQKGQILYRQGNYEMAMLTFNRGTKLNPSAPGFLEGIQKAQHAIDIMATGRHMKTTPAGDLSMYIPKKQSSFQLSKKTLPSLPKTSTNDNARLPSPGFRKRHGTLLLQVHKRHSSMLGQPKYGRVDADVDSRRNVNDRAMKEILGQLYEDKAYFERILNGTAQDQGLSDMLSSVLEDGLKFLYDRVLFWAQNGSLPPAPPQPQPISAGVRAVKAAPASEASKETQENADSSGESEEEEDSNDEIMAKVTDAIDAVSSVNEPGTGKKKKKRLKVRKRRADILKKKASMVVVPRKKHKKPHTSRMIMEQDEEEQEGVSDVSKVNFQFNSLSVLRGIGDADDRGGSAAGTTTMDESDVDASTADAMDRQLRREEKRRRRMEKKEKKEKERREQEERMREKEIQQSKGGSEQQQQQQETKQEDPLIDYLDKMMNSMEEIYQKMEYPTLKTKAESFLLTMEKYDRTVTGGKMAYVAKAHSYLGNAYVGLNNYDFAIMHFEKDKEIGERWQMPHCVSRALGNIGRVYVYRKKYAEALKYLAQKTKMANSPKENAWLYHEIASCFLQLHHYHFARDAASKSFKAAAEINDSLYQLQSSVLLGAIEVKLQNFERAYGSFERAMDHARLRDDKRAQQAITEALAEVNGKIAREAKLKKLLQEQHEKEMLLKQQQQQQQQEQVNEEDSDENETVNEAGSQCGKEGEVREGSELGVAESAANTGEDPELSGLAASEDEMEGNDEKVEMAEDGEKEEQDAEALGGGEEGEKSGGREGEESEMKTEEKEEGENVTENKEDEIADEKTDEEGKNVDDNSNGTTTVNGEAVDENKVDGKQDEDEGKKDAETKPGDKEGSDKTGTDEEKDEKADKGVGDDDQKEDASVEKAEESKNEAVQESRGENEKTSDVVIVVTGDVKEGDDKEKDGDEKTASDEGSDITYKARPITQDSLSKSLSVDDRRNIDGLKKSVVSLHEAVRDSETRQGLRKTENIEASTKKKVTISDEPEILDDQKRKKDEEETKKLLEEESIPQEPRGKDRICDKVEDELILMEKEYADKQFDDVLKRGNELMKVLKKLKNIDGWSKRRLMNFAKLHSFMGSASSEKQNFDKARMHHNADLKIGEVIQNNFIQSRALEHLGRTFIFEKKHEKALEFFARRAHLPRNSEVTARLFHEIANCFFQLKAYEFAKDAAMVSLKAANQGHHSMFQLQSSVLIGVTKVKLMRTDAAYSTFQEALNFALIRDDENAADAIRQAMAQIETRVATDVKNRWMQKVKDSRNAKDNKAGKEAGPMEEPTSQGSNGNASDVEPSKAVIDVLNSMNEGEKSQDVVDEVQEDSTTQEEDGGQSGMKAGSETSRTDKSGFLVAPDGIMDKKEKVNKVIKMSKETDQDQTGGMSGARKKVKKAGSDNPEAKTSSKQAPQSSKNSNQQNEAKTKQQPKPSKILAAKASKTTTDSGKNKRVSNSSNPADGSGNGQKQDSIGPEETTGKNGMKAEEADLVKAAAGSVHENKNMGESNEGNGNEATKSEPVGECQEAAVNKKEINPTLLETEHNKDNKETGPAGEQVETKGIGDGEKSTSKNTDSNEERGNSETTNRQTNSKVETQSDQQAKQEESDQGNEGVGGKKDKQEVDDVALDTIKEGVTTTDSKKDNANEGDTTKIKPRISMKKKKTFFQDTTEAKPVMQRRPSERFIGLDPKKIAAAKSNPNQKQEEQKKLEQPPPKPKLPRFVGISPRKEKPKEETADGSSKRQNKMDDNSKTTESSLNQTRPAKGHGTEKVPALDLADKKKKKNQPPAPTVPGTEADISPSPKKATDDPAIATATTNNNDNNDGYDANLGSDPIITLNDEIGLVRKDSISSHRSITRPATRMSLADMVKDDNPPAPDTSASKAELSALNALVKESIKRDKKEMKKIKHEQSGAPSEPTELQSPRKAAKMKETNAVIQRYKIEELRREAAAKRARRQRFLRNRKASFIMMLTSPYSETSSVRKLSYDFIRLRRSMADANLSLALNEDGTYYEDFVHDKHGNANLPWKNERELYHGGDNMSPRKAMAMGLRRGSNRKYSNTEESSVSTKDSENVLDSIENYLQRDATGVGHGVNQPQKSRHRKAEENRISKEIELAARQMRRREREERRDQRIRLEKEERKRRKDEIEEKELLAIMANKQSFSNPYNKKPGKIPELDQADRFHDDEEKRWIHAQERKILRERRRSRREAEIMKKQDDEKRKRKAAMKTPIGRSPRSQKGEAITDNAQEKPGEITMDESLDVSPELETPRTQEGPAVEVEEDGGEELKEEEKERETKEDEPVTEKDKIDEEDVKEDGDKKEGEVEEKEEAEKEKGDAEKEKEEAEKEKEEADKEGNEKGDVDKGEEEEEETKADEEEIEEDDFDGYNDSEEDDDDLVAVYIEKEVRQMRADYNVQKIQEVVNRGTDLLKALRKHTDIVSWSRRRLRWFAAAHSYMGSGYTDLKDWGKSTSHHRADYRIGEALEDTNIQSRALENLARVSIHEGNTPKALEHLAKRAHLPRNPEQSARIYHEMANCFFQLGALEYSRDAAIESLQAAKETNNTIYTLQSTLILAVCQSKLSDFDNASNSFEVALREAKKLDDTNTMAAIVDAKKQLEMRRAAKVRDKWKKKMAGGDLDVDEPITEADETNS